ncbi:hypothetical protein [Leptothermofonsia sp. ETS-13]|uniref:hypothetical protein n=1 Tax=Leptothermofonsia sp. ETS-13 TaxID=3035696 RepID=UPI003BA2AE94
MKASPLPTTLSSQPWKRLNQKRFNYPSSARKSSKQSTRKRPRDLTTPPPISPVLIDEAIVTITGRTYGAIFSEPIPEPAILVPAASAPVRSWKLWVHGLFTILSLFAVTLGIGPRSYAAGENGAIDFSLPSDSTSADDSFSVPSINDEFLPESNPEPEAAPNISQSP